MIAVCKGCGLQIVVGDLRRGDEWHAICFPTRAERPAPLTPRVTGVRGLTSTQEIILRAAAASPSGSVGFGAGDRKGTRVSMIDDFDRPWITAYATPEWFLLHRGLLAKSNEPYVYRITDAGRAALSDTGSICLRKADR